jgi:high-affinity iron transporter
LNSDATAAVLDIGVLVFREGLECILVLAAVTAGMVGSSAVYRRPVAVGTGVAALATLITWRIAIGVIDDLGQKISALALQAATGLVAIVVLLIVMNWFFHKLYWTGWISLHTKRKQELLGAEGKPEPSKMSLWWGLAALGFTSLYREGFEVVLFLQSYRLKLGAGPIRYGVMLGVLFSAIVAALTFFAHRRLPYRRMLVLTGILLGGVLLVMVGEQAQEMQFAHWLPTTDLPRLASFIPAWMGLWFSIFPTVETLSAQAMAGVLVVGSYFAARLGSLRTASDR